MSQTRRHRRATPDLLSWAPRRAYPRPTAAASRRPIVRQNAKAAPSAPRTLAKGTALPVAKIQAETRKHLHANNTHDTAQLRLGAVRGQLPMSPTLRDQK